MPRITSIYVDARVGPHVTINVRVDGRTAGALIAGTREETEMLLRILTLPPTEPASTTLDKMLAHVARFGGELSVQHPHPHATSVRLDGWTPDAGASELAPVEDDGVPE